MSNILEHKPSSLAEWMGNVRLPTYLVKSIHYIFPFILFNC